MSSVEQRVQAFFASLERALGGPHEQSDAVQAELRADLEAQVGDAVAAGADRDAAWRDALAAMGEPEALARSMRGALPPSMPRAWARNLRMIGAGLVVAWTVSVFCSFRSWSYGIDLRFASIVLGVHLPLVLLLWPGVIWRWNPLFYTGSSLTFLFVLLLVEKGMSAVPVTPITYELEESEELAVAGAANGAGSAAAPMLTGWDWWDVLPWLLAGLFAGLIALTFWMIQRRRQRWLALACTIGLMAPVETVYQVEEGLFRAEAQHAAAWVDARFEERGRLPTSEEFAQEYEARWLSRLYYFPGEGTDPDGSPSWSLQWSRATARSCELGYHSDGTFWGND